MGAKRLVSLLPRLRAEIIEWPVPFADGLACLASRRGCKVVVLASGDPFWFGAGSVIARDFDASEWRAIPAPSTFSIAASRLGWALERTVCLGLHAAPFSRLRPYLSHKTRCLVLLRDGASVGGLVQYLVDTGFSESRVTVLEALGGPRERITSFVVNEEHETSFQHPVCVAVDVRGRGVPVPKASGLPDALFQTDGVMTKRPVRAMTLSALAPVSGELLWDIGGGSGSIAIEWLLADARCEAIAIEPRKDRVALIDANAKALGVDRLRVVTGHAPEVLDDLPKPDAVFVGGGLSAGMLPALETLLPAGTRVVANAVTLEAEVLLTKLYERKGGDLHRIEIAQAGPLGNKTAWKAAYPVVQWSGAL